jgi:hypothetical protein
MTYTFPRVRKSSTQLSIVNHSGIFHRASEVNSIIYTNIEFSVPQSSAPSGLMVHKLSGGKQLIVLPYGRNANNDTFRMAVQYWYPIYDNKSTRTSGDIGWIPVTAAIIDCRLVDVGNHEGNVGPLILNNTTDDFFCDYIAAMRYTDQQFTVGINDFTNTDGAPAEGANDSYCSFVLNTFGASYVEFFFDRNGSDFEEDGVPLDPAESANCLFMEI